MLIKFASKSFGTLPNLIGLGTAFLLCFLMGSQCSGTGSLSGTIGVYNNTSDPTNGGASFVGSAACSACHSSYADLNSTHGHAHALTRIEGGPPSYPPAGIRAGVPDPPQGQVWSNISYLVGGYSKAALFVDAAGFVMTNGQLGVDTLWNLSFPVRSTTPAFAPYKADAAAPLPFDYSCFKCHSTGALPRDADHPGFQDNRPGMAGTFSETGVQCEACHGPGSNHIPNRSARNIFVPTKSEDCGKCHSGTNPDVIEADQGFVAHNQQFAELRSSGGHAQFSCLICHDSHNSTVYNRDKGIRNNCVNCHSDQNMALHDGKVFTRGDYSETLTCESCHMPYASLIGSPAGSNVVGPNGRMGDTRTHIFRIRAEEVGFGSFLSGDGRSILKDSEGRAAVTVDYVCLRCHNGIALFNLTVPRAGEIAPNLHKVFP